MIRTFLISLLLLSTVFPLKAQIREEMKQYSGFTIRGPVLRVDKNTCVVSSFGRPEYTEHPSSFITYNAHGDIESWESEPGAPLRQCSYTYDSLGRLADVSILWRAGGLMAVFEPYGMPMIEEHERYAYDEEGKLRTVERWRVKDDILICRVEYAYDSLGRLAETIRRDYARYTHEIRRVEQLQIVEEPTAMRTIYSYDSAGRIQMITKIGNADRSEILSRQHWSYSSDGGSRMNRWEFYGDYSAGTEMVITDSNGWIVMDSTHMLLRNDTNYRPLISRHRYVRDSLGNAILAIFTSDDGISDTIRCAYLYDVYGNWTTEYYYARRKWGYHDRHPVGPYDLEMITERKIEYFPED